MKTTSTLGYPLALELAISVLSAKAGLVGHWTFDEGGGTSVTDSSGFANNGVIVGLQSFTWTNGVRGGALYFDGTTGAGSTYVTIPDTPSLHLTNAGSFAAWVRCDDTGRDGPILDQEGDGQLAYWFGVLGPSHFGVLLDTDGNQPWTLYDRDQGSLPEGQWVHLASVREGTVVRHYLNGIPLGSTGGSFTGPAHISDAFLAIGVNSLYNFAVNHTAFLGAIDEVRLYNYALSETEVAALYAEAVKPALHIERQANTVTVSWPTPADGWVLENTNVLPSSAVSWPQVAPPYQTNTDAIFVTFTNTPSTGNQFFRLHKP